MKILGRFLSALSLAVLFKGTLAMAAVSVPFSTNFPNETSIADFTSTGGTWSIQNGKYRNALGGSTPSSSTVRVTSGLEQGFQLSTTYTLVSRGGAISNTFVGFAALAPNADATTATSSTPFILADVISDGNLRIVLVNGTNNPTPLATAALPANTIATGGTYTLTLTGIYATGGLDLTFSLTSNGVTTSASGRLEGSNVPTGEYFGFRNRSGGGGTSITADFHDISLNAIPEPGATALLLLGGAAALVRRRR
ncbi:MAG: PEP-CTERM sorting domain-containing protein [Akkermansiaceae bacterium]|nr:PEP-CTERM sorting domain-containing protein [Akkermansiaceae bacterium]